MSADSGAANGSTVLKKRMRNERIYLCEFERQTDADGRYFYTGEFVTPNAGKHRYWKWTLLRSGCFMFNLCVEPLSILPFNDSFYLQPFSSNDTLQDHRSVTLNSVVLHGGDAGPLFFLLTMKENIGQPCCQSGDFSVASSLPRLEEAFRRNPGVLIHLSVNLVWTEAEVNAAPIPVSPAQPCVLEHQYNKVMEGGDIVYKLVSSDGQSFCVNVTILEAKSAYFQRFFATEGWKEQTDGRMKLSWTSAVVRQLMRYVYLNEVDGNICDFLPDLLDAAQIWELIGMKSLIEGQMKQRLQKAARDADTDTAAEYLQMAHLHSLASLVPVCNGILAANYDKFHDSGISRQMDQNETYRHLMKGIFHHKRK